MSKVYILLLSIILILSSFATSRAGKQESFVQLDTHLTPSISHTPKDTSSASSHPSPTPTQESQWRILKDVGEPYLDHFGLTKDDFSLISQAGTTTIEGNFDICASDEDVEFFLSQADRHALTVILPAGSGEAEWGYACDTFIPDTQKPIWRKEAVQQWIKKWKDHPAVFAWDISNEAGGVFPNGEKDSFKLTLSQLQEAYRDVSNEDPDHPILIRMNGWYFYDYETDFFRRGNPFGKGCADIVMINTYSNVEDYFPDFVSTVTERATKAIRSLEPDMQFVVSLGVWEEPPLWYTPTLAHLRNDIRQMKKLDLSGQAFFKYGAAQGEWYLPDSTKGAPQLLDEIQSLWSDEKG